MKWFKENWVWLLVNLIAILPLFNVISLFQIDLSGVGPLISVELPVRFSEARHAGETLLTNKSALWLPIHFTGEWAIRWLTISLSITPLMILFGFKKIRRYRKLFGLYAFGYVLIHFLFFVADKSLWAVFDETNFILGLASFLILIPLAITSNRWSIRALKKKWKALQKWAYVAGILAILHVAFLERGSWELYAILTGLGFILRWIPVKNFIVESRMARKARKARI